MEVISNTLFWISNGLLVPVILLLLVFFLRAVLLILGFFNEFYQRKKILIATDFINSSSRDQLVDGIEKLSEENHSRYIDSLKTLLRHSDNTHFCERLVANYEVDSAKELGNTRLLVKLGPMLGLMGTLIPMGPALVGLSTGDIASMAYNMQVAFATTVVGMVIAAIGVVTTQVRQRWYAKEMNNLDYVEKMLCHETKQTAQ